MSVSEIIRTSLRALLLNKSRTLLTMLGVIIGVFAVVMMVALGRGAQNYITDQFEALGSNLVFVNPGNAGFGRDPAESFSRNKLEYKHLELIQRYLSNEIENLTPWVSVGGTAYYKNKTYFASINGVSREGVSILNYTIKDGRSFTDAEVKTSKKVAIIGPLVAEELFGQNSPVGKQIKIDEDAYQIIGMFNEKGSNYDNGLVLPYTAAEKTFDVKNLSGIAIKAPEGADIDTLIKQIDRVVQRDLRDDDFSVISQQEILGSIQSILGVLTTGIGAIAGISLLVGGIGIMNIMLVSVTERTREIGLRKALGATPNNIAIQFLVEAVFISIGGGLIGLILGYGGSAIAQNFLRTEIPLWAIGLAFGFSAFVGVVFGTYPAVKASKKDPIEALRFE